MQVSSGPRALGLRDRYIKDWSHRLALNSTPGFLGPTSFSAVYSENEASLKQNASFTSLQLPVLSPPCVQNIVCTVDDRRVQLGAELLSLLFHDFSLYRRTAIAGEEQSSEGIMNLPIIRTICDLVEEMFSTVPGHLDPQSQLLVLSRRLFEGTTRELVTHKALTYDEYLVTLAGRWEAIGFIFIMSGTCAAHTTVDDTLFRGLGLSVEDHRNLGILAIAGSDLCLQFCNSMGVMGETLAWLLLQHVHLLTLVCGDFGKS